MLGIDGIAPFFHQWNHQTPCIPSCHDEICCCGSLSFVQYGGPFGRRIFRLRTLGLCKTFVPWNCRLGAQLVVLVLETTKKSMARRCASCLSLKSITFRRVWWVSFLCPIIYCTCFCGKSATPSLLFQRWLQWPGQSVRIPSMSRAQPRASKSYCYSIFHLNAPPFKPPSGLTYIFYIFHVWTAVNHRNDPQPTMSQPIPKHEKEVVWPVLVEPGSLATELDLVGDAILKRSMPSYEKFLPQANRSNRVCFCVFFLLHWRMLDSAGAKTCFFWGRVEHCGENWKESSTVGRPSTTSNTRSNPGSSSRFLASSSEALKLLLGQLLINEIMHHLGHMKAYESWGKPLPAPITIILNWSSWADSKISGPILSW